VLSDGLSGRIIAVTASDAPVAVRRIAEAASEVEELTGVAPGWLLSGTDWKVGLCGTVRGHSFGVLEGGFLTSAVR